MADGKFTLYIRKVIVNPMLGRKQMAVELLHPEMAGLKRSEVKAAVAKKFKASEDRIAVFGVKAKFGGGRSSGFVTVYDDVDARVKYDNKTNLKRDKIGDLPGRTARKMAKELKGKRKRVKGTAKSKVVAGKKKR
mmetsp:Transcript_41323/g.54321  ORF Transcript_41323/g.54321 Transcript_41323/m.54321 type:complete len:135 (+) Transcript_41323:735-1139(+)|eukprot:CAMPEP_0185567462 /NCGR_PEP_ID=MMETSP0434-20130131/725_1 /TAXON_ID=626734 ORGANISM="Favella taraikaensis, Strain Fe Narragansett Bay" /NCGR_SAMPLE_ID=MMETSP0434 /ASSEMBLY_ACC=CAM_ASM_000379 /LENGTH=134 /DNA_ID=CAMNT_0028181707 /DNA_START=770 /DNA_END=1174 /DNA_ORIENTATION=+